VRLVWLTHATPAVPRTGMPAPAMWAFASAIV
jgi:hypothetical protein